jgi:hypothetical protein
MRVARLRKYYGAAGTDGQSRDPTGAGELNPGFSLLAHVERNDSIRR